MKRSILLLLLLGGVLSNLRANDSQLIFDHDLHVNEEEIECLDCHPSALILNSENTRQSLVPDEEACLLCHEDWKEEGDCSLCHAPTGFSYSPPETYPDIIFAHKRHTTEDEPQCTTCHANFVGANHHPELPVMKDCVQCHDSQSAPIDCQTCHPANLVLRPETHGSDWITDHGFAANVDDSDCQTCHVQLTCDNCHSGATLVHDGLMLDRPIPGFRNDLTGNQQLLNRVHELNYLNTHGFDATSHRLECANCHETQTFCAVCHQNENEVLLNKPDWHGGLDWGAVKYGSSQDFSNGIDGGRHATLARRDIERCQSCHDVEGGDPTCISCHKDVDGIQYTDPKTHAAGYLHDVQGDWCTKNVSLCFSCHRQEEKGQGFCGYCH